MPLELPITVAQMLVPEEILACFEIESIEENLEDYVISLHEKKTCLPKSIYRKKRAVLDGYLHPLELQTFPIKGKAVYLRLYRRLWKEHGKGGDRGFSNTYNFHHPGMKATKEFGAFLKEAFGD